jgi:hypothetical protein
MAADASQLIHQSQSQLDQMFTDGAAGAIPTGDAQGTAIVAPGKAYSGLLSTLIRGLAWKGKVIDSDGTGLRNKVTPFGIRAIRASIYKEPSWFDAKECIVLDYSKTSLVARFIRDEIREVSPGQFLGIVYMGKRKTVNFYLDFAA